MNASLDRIKKIDSQLTALDAIIRSREHIGAGLSLHILVGPERDDSEFLNLEISSGAPELLSLLRNSLLASRDLNVSLARLDLKELTTFFKGQESDE